MTKTLKLPARLAAVMDRAHVDSAWFVSRLNDKTLFVVTWKNKGIR